MSWVERAKVGDKIVCIKVGNYGRWKLLTVGAVYTISRINGPECVLDTSPCYFGLQEFDFAQAGHFDCVAFKPAKDTTLQVEAIKRAALDVPAKSPETVA